MLIRWIALTSLLLAGTALAETQDPEKAALGEMVMQGVQREAALRAEVFSLKAEIAKAKQAPEHKDQP